MCICAWLEEKEVPPCWWQPVVTALCVFRRFIAFLLGFLCTSGIQICCFMLLDIAQHQDAFPIIWIRCFAFLHRPRTTSNAHCPI